MFGPHLQSALRELQREVTDARAWLLFALVVLILGYSGPFQTFEALSIGPRFAYWGIMAAATYVTGAFFANWAACILMARRVNSRLLVPLIGLIAAVPVAMVVFIVNALTFGPENFSLVELASIVVFSAIVAIMVAAVSMIATRTSRAKSGATAQNATRLMERLPHHKRGQLISMSVNDHYVDVTTSAGTELVLMRFRDAIAETEGVDGLQVHRSHWVALDQIADVRRRDGRVTITLKNGNELPVSRSYHNALKAHKLL